MSPFSLFNPLDPSILTGQVDPARLLGAAAGFPGGAALLVFALFWSPVGPGIPAGVLLARHAGLPPLATFGLYTLSDVLGALISHPTFALVRRVGGRVPILRRLGGWFLKLALIGSGTSAVNPPPPEPGSPPGAPRAALPALFRIGTVGFGVDVYTAGMLVAGLPVSRLTGWGAAIAGDLVWFALLLGTSLATAAIVDDDRVVGIVVLVAMVVIPVVARRIFPALRTGAPPPRAGAPAPAAPASSAPASSAPAVTREASAPAADRTGRGRAPRPARGRGARGGLPPPRSRAAGARPGRSAP
jgi:hypothetical protein